MSKSTVNLTSLGLFDNAKVQTKKNPQRAATLRGTLRM